MGFNIFRSLPVQAGHRLKTAIAALFTVASVAIVPGYAQQWPERPVRMIVPFAPGGLADIVCRAASEQFGKLLGQPFVVENMAGAGGVIGADTVAKARPDGYTVLCTSSSPLAYAPALRASMPYDSVTSFTHAAYVGTTPSALVVKASLPITSFQELIDYAKAHPGELNYASSGVGANTHLGTELLKFMTGTDIVHIPYQGGAPALGAMGSGEVDLYIGVVPTVMLLLEGGNVRVLATTGQTRSMALPDAPTIAESGLPDYQLDTWYALSFPAGTETAIAEALRAATEKAMSDPKTKEFLVKQGMEPGTKTLAELAEYIGNDRDRWKQVAVQAGIPLQ